MKIFFFVKVSINKPYIKRVFLLSPLGHNITRDAFKRSLESESGNNGVETVFFCGFVARLDNVGNRNSSTAVESLNLVDIDRSEKITLELDFVACRDQNGQFGEENRSRSENVVRCVVARVVYYAVEVVGCV